MTELTCDVLVIGGGTAGSVLASRLSEDPALRVVLLEAGGQSGPPEMAIPPAWPALQGSDVDWAFRTAPQRAIGDVTLTYPRGKVLGGSSAINAMFHLRGHREDYDGWERNGAHGWGYDQLLPFFKRTEHAPGRNPVYRGVDGPMVVGPATDRHPIAVAGMAALEEAGLPITSDLNGEDQVGGAWIDLNTPSGRRQSAFDGYLRPHLDRPNLRVVTDAHVTSLVLSGTTCTGAKFVKDGLAQNVTATESILCAGAVGSPQLLMLSGIGPAAELSRLGLAVYVDAPEVGRNLQDHPLVGVVYSSSVELPPTVNVYGDSAASLFTEEGLSQPDVQVLFCDVPLHSSRLNGPASGYTMLCTVFKPHSRGTVTLASADPHAMPVIDPNYFSDERDIHTMAAALKLARRIGETEAFAPFRDAEVLPGPAVVDDDAFAEYIRKATETYYHTAGTCRMGSDPLAVVDCELRVNGVDGLRVADASVMPTLVSANTNATVLAIAERAAELVKEAAR